MFDRRSPTIFVVQLKPDARSHPLHRFGESRVIHALEEREDIAVFTAPETVIATDLRTHVEARAALIVERAETLHRAHARTLESDEITDDIGDVDARPHLVDIVSSDQARHVPILRSDGCRRDEPLVPDERRLIGERCDLVNDGAPSIVLGIYLDPVIGEAGVEGRRTGRPQSIG